MKWMFVGRNDVIDTVNVEDDKECVVSKLDAVYSYV